MNKKRNHIPHNPVNLLHTCRAPLMKTSLRDCFRLGSIYISNQMFAAGLLYETGFNKTFLPQNLII